jgi:hypothetical protein
MRRSTGTLTPDATERMPPLSRPSRTSAKSGSVEPGPKMTNSPTVFTDAELLAEVSRAAAQERTATAHLIALLGELDARRLYLGEGCCSLFTYCTQVLHLSDARVLQDDRLGFGRQSPLHSRYRVHKEAGDGNSSSCRFLSMSPVVTVLS